MLKIWRHLVLVIVSLIVGYQLADLALMTAAAQGATAIRCAQRPPTMAMPPNTPPAPRLGAAATLEKDLSENAALVKPACPEGQIPVFPSGAAAAVRLAHPKGNPLLRPQGGTPPGAAKTLRFEELYSVPGGAPSQKEGLVQPCPNYNANTCYYYASAGLRSGTGGGGMTISVNSPKYINAGAQGHTLDEISVQGGANDGNIVELGWLVSTDQNGDADPHIFVFHWIDWDGQGYNGFGWQQFSNKYYPGQNIGALKGRDVYVGYVLFKGNWWAWFDNQWLGYFPGSLWHNAYTQVSLIQWFGEVATTNSAPPHIQMGDGILPPPVLAAHMTTLCEVDADAWLCRIGDKQTLASPTNAKYYDIRRVGAGETRYGGPGE